MYIYICIYNVYIYTYTHQYIYIYISISIYTFIHIFSRMDSSRIVVDYYSYIPSEFGIKSLSCVLRFWRKK